MNYESDINELLLSSLIKTFNITSMVKLHSYLHAKFLLQHNIKEKSFSDEIQRDFMSFILHILNIEGCEYRGETLSFFRYDDNSLIHIYDDWMFRLEMMHGVTHRDLMQSVHETLKQCEKRAKGDARKYKGHFEYNNILKEKKYDAVNMYFGVTQTVPASIPGFRCGANYLPEELVLSRSNRLILREKTLDVLVSEKAVEDFLYKNLELVEVGLTPISRQYRLPHGVIDILARDKDGALVIIELKVEDDKDILW